MKGQTALEYLLTYGWAILVIMVVLAVLYYYHVFDPKCWSEDYYPECHNLQPSCYETIIGKYAGVISCNDMNHCTFANKTCYCIIDENKNLQISECKEIIKPIR
jgi:hypothetical protein